MSRKEWNKGNTFTDDVGGMVMRYLSGLYQYRNRIDSIEAETYMYGVTEIIKKTFLLVH